MALMTRLSVNVNKVALIRNSRMGELPSVVGLAKLALDAGAHGITVHPRPDQRHIRPYDVDQISEMIKQPAYGDREFNMEGNPLIGHYLELAARVKPDQCTLVPDHPDQKTSDHGWDLSGDMTQLMEIVKQLHDLGCRVSLFMNPDIDAIDQAAQTGADRIELYTEQYAATFKCQPEQLDRVYQLYAAAAGKAQALNLGVNAGHDLNLDNLGRFLSISGILEVSIGHAIITDALKMGMRQAVKSYLNVVMNQSSATP